MDIDWDEEADTFDEEPDHGLLDPAVRAAWDERLAGWLPDHAGELLDLGCGTGSLSLLAAGRGHRITAVDLSPRMVERARAKLAGTGAEVLTGDAARPPVEGRTFDVILARHVVWALPDHEAALRHWWSLLRPGGRLILVEGVWGDTGIPAGQLVGALGGLKAEARYERLSGDARLWGREVDDERYAVVATAAVPVAA
ncbi:SAM-dependent methyltransferase [Streptomyces violascens]|uniref:SAM-dependent methyltransferase n=1 Tax=Streptomyces violascens TaxID=67381 RepID=A0ABQ3QIL2_9ACTN|nr:SAM-dependent methyltransferase [Streptomyces violascens]GHI37132.1 SAM-dependent methyltransferase [Streptomyces violascens]